MSLVLGDVFIVQVNVLPLGLGLWVQLGGVAYVSLDSKNGER